MTDFNRAERESLLAYAISREFARFRKYLQEAIPELDSQSGYVPQSELNKHTAALIAAIQPNLQGTYMTAADATLDEFSYLGVDDYGELSNDAALWASLYTIDLVGRLNQTSEKSIRQTIEDFLGNDLTRTALLAALMGAFGPRRSTTIAITETTTGITNGQDGASDALSRDNGVAFRTIWMTEDDEAVCIVCRPLHEKEIAPISETGGRRPPAHPICRCEEKKEVIGE